MDITVEGILVATLMILPGFAASSVQRAFIGQKGSEAQWIAVSALRSLVLNALTAIALTLAVKIIYWDLPVNDLSSQLSLLTVRQVGLYLLVLYALAISHGLAFGLLWKYGPTVAFRIGWTPVSPYEDVFTDALDSVFGSKENRKLSGDSKQKIPWLWVNLEAKIEVLGALKRSSVDIEQDKPFEIFLQPVYTRGQGGCWEKLETPYGTEAVGAHIRIEPKTPVFVFSAPRNWSLKTDVLEASEARHNPSVASQLRKRQIPVEARQYDQQALYTSWEAYAAAAVFVVTTLIIAFGAMRALHLI